MKPRTATIIALAAITTVGLEAPASAADRARTTVTIEAESGGFFGYVSSPDADACANGRKIVLFRQVGDVQDPTVDIRIASDTADLNGDRYMWSTGNTGSRTGRFYARARRTAECRPDSSPTIRAQR